jgi:hypothetical protein
MREARRALGADAIESAVVARNGIIVETVTSVDAAPGEPRYTRRGYQAPPGKRLWEATSSAGWISVRASAIEMRFATNVVDPGGATDRARLGQIRSFFSTRDQAIQQADALRETGYMVTIVDARPYGGQAGDASV